MVGSEARRKVQPFVFSDRIRSTSSGLGITGTTSHNQECAQDGSPRHQVSWRTVLKTHEDLQDTNRVFKTPVKTLKYVLKTPFQDTFQDVVEKFTRHRQET